MYATTPAPHPLTKGGKQHSSTPGIVRPASQNPPPGALPSYRTDMSSYQKPANRPAQSNKPRGDYLTCALCKQLIPMVQVKEHAKLCVLQSKSQYAQSNNSFNAATAQSSGGTRSEYSFEEDIEQKRRVERERIERDQLERKRKEDEAARKRQKLEEERRQQEEEERRKREEEEMQRRSQHEQQLQQRQMQEMQRQRQLQEEQKRQEEFERKEREEREREEARQREQQQKEERIRQEQEQRRFEEDMEKQRLLEEANSKRELENEAPPPLPARNEETMTEEERAAAVMAAGIYIYVIIMSFCSTVVMTALEFSYIFVSVP